MTKTYEDYLQPIIVTEFNREDVFRFRKQILQETLISQTLPIQVYIDSDGGDIDGLAAIVEIMKSVPNPIHTICIGRAQSAGAFLLSLGDRRYCGEHSYVMIHKISAGAIGHIDDLKNSFTETTRVNDFWFDKLAEKCNTTRAEIYEMLNAIEGRDLHLNPLEALNFGIVDEVGVPEMKLKPRRVTRRRKRVRKKRRPRAG